MCENHSIEDQYIGKPRYLCTCGIMADACGHVHVESFNVSTGYRNTTTFFGRGGFPNRNTNVVASGMNIATCVNCNHRNILQSYTESHYYCNKCGDNQHV